MRDTAILQERSHWNLTPGRSSNFRRLLDMPEQGFAVLRKPLGPESLKDLECTPGPRRRILKPVLSIINLSLHKYRATQHVWTIDRVRPGLFDVSVRVVEIVFIAKQLRQVVMDPK